MTLSVTVQVPEDAQNHAEIVELDLDPTGAVIGSRRTSLPPGRAASFHAHTTRTLQVIEGRCFAIRTDPTLVGPAVDFGAALRALKAGERVARAGWNGRGMFVVMMPPLYLPPFNTQDTARKVNDRTAKWIGEDQPLDCQGYFAMYTAARQWQPGWLASQVDMLAEDWLILPAIATPAADKRPA